MKSNIKMIWTSTHISKYYKMIIKHIWNTRFHICFTCTCVSHSRKLAFQSTGILLLLASTSPRVVTSTSPLRWYMQSAYARSGSQPGTCDRLSERQFGPILSWISWSQRQFEVGPIEIYSWDPCGSHNARWRRGSTCCRHQWLKTSAAVHGICPCSVG